MRLGSLVLALVLLAAGCRTLDIYHIDEEGLIWTRCVVIELERERVEDDYGRWEMPDPWSVETERKRKCRH